MFPTILLRVIWREYLVYALIFTLLSSMWLLRLGAPGLVYAFWVKLLGGLVILLTLYFRRRKYLYVFFNLGYSKRQVLGLLLLSEGITSSAIYIPCLILYSCL